MKIHFGHLLAASALAVAGCAAFFSVFGLSQLFAGASLAVIIMASALEFSKVVSASFLHKYWDDMARTLKIYLTVGVIVLVTITSAGIYGFLSSAYQQTKSNLEVHNGEVGILEGKVAQFQSKIDANKSLIESRTKRINQLNDLRNGQETRLGDRRAASATRKDIASSNSEIKELNANIDQLNAENSKLLDSVGVYNVKKLETTSNSKVAGEVGPLKYLAELTGKPMDTIVNYFILLLVFVFDPLAISLVIATTWVFEKRRKDALVKPVVEELEVGDDSAWGEIKDIDISEPTVEDNKSIDFDPLTKKDVGELKTKGIDAEAELSRILNEDFQEELNKAYGEKLMDVYNGMVNEEVENPQLEIDFNAQPETTSQEEMIDEEEEIVADDSVHVDEVPNSLYGPVIPTGKVERDDIKEIKERARGFSVKIPEAKSSIQRIGSHKYRDTDNNNVIFKKGK